MSIQSEEQEQQMYFNQCCNTSVCTQKAVKKAILRTDGADCPRQKKKQTLTFSRYDKEKATTTTKGDQFLYCVRVFKAIRKHTSFEITKGIFLYSLYLCLSNSLFFLYAPFDLSPNTSLHDMQDTIYRSGRKNPIIRELRF